MSVVDEIRSKVDIVSVISEFVSLKKKGNNYVSSCPFLDHDDKAPSFSVSQSKQIYKCFGCQRGGNVFTFLMEYNRMSFGDALRWLAEREGVALPFYEKDNFDLLYDIHEKACILYSNALIGDYFTVQRGLTDEIIQRYRLGFCVGYCLDDIENSYGDSIVEASGLVITNKNFVKYELFKGRFIFPLIDISGRVIGFGGRGDKPKYLNSPDTNIYKKSEFLYGLYQAKGSILEQGYVYVVEGYFDCLSMVQAGYNNTVAVCGTSLTSAQAKLLKRYTNKFVLVYDGDAAGRKAVDTSFVSLFSEGANTVVFALTPEGQDPDSILKEGDIKDVVFVSWFDALKDRKKEDGLAEVVNFVKDIGDDIEDQGRRLLFISVCADKLEIDERVLVTNRVVYSNKRKRNSSEIFIYYQELILLAAYIGEKDRVVDESLLETEDLVILCRKIQQLNEEDKSLSFLYDNLSTDLSIAMGIVIEMSSHSLDFDQSLKQVKGKIVTKMLNKVLERIGELKGGSAIELSKLVKELNRLKEIRRSLF